MVLDSLEGGNEQHNREELDEQNHCQLSTEEDVNTNRECEGWRD